MNRCAPLSILVFILFFTAAIVQAAEYGFVPLFDGKALDGWPIKNQSKDKQLAATCWKIDDGTLLANSLGRKEHDYVWLATDREYGDFTLRLRFQVEWGITGNSGIQIRSCYDDKASWMNGRQIDINPLGPWRTDMIWDETKGVQRWLYPKVPKDTWVDQSMAPKGFTFFYADEHGGWNDLEISAKGMKIRAWLNGIKVTDYDGTGVLDDKVHQENGVGKKGIIALQTHAHDEVKIRFKDIRVKLGGNDGRADGSKESKATYDPLLTANAKPEQKDLIIKDEKRSRDIPIRVFIPKDKAPAAVVLFSHGLGGTRAGCAYLGNHWALRGYVAVFLQHPGSDDSVWKDKPVAERMAAMQKAANLANFRLRVQDVSAVLDQLEHWNKTESHPLAGRLDMNRIGMSGHSFGAVTTQAVSGQTFPLGKRFTDARIKAAVIMSPSGPRGGGDPRVAFGRVKIPWMLLTGTEDNSPIGDASAKSRLAVFPALPPGGKYELILDKAEHSAFTDRELPGETHKHNPNHHRAILALTTAFWDAYLRDDQEAKRWLDGVAVQAVLEKDDRWQRK